MKERLNNLKNDMDDTVLRQLRFEEHNKEAVRKSFRKKPTKQKVKRFPLIASAAFTVLLMSGISYGMLSHVSAPNSTEPQPAPTNEVATIELASEPAQESMETLTKTDLLLKVLNAIDYFDTAAGEYTTFDAFYDGSVSRTSVSYIYSNSDVIGGYEKVVNELDENNPFAERSEYEYYYKDSTFWALDRNRGTYRQHSYTLQPKKPKVQPADVFALDLYSVYDSEASFRERPPIRGNLFNGEFIAKYLRNVDTWDIEQQNVPLLNHNTLVIAGDIAASIRESNYVQPDEHRFRLWIDKDTGIVMKQEIYNEAGDVVSSLTMSSLVVNEHYAAEEFIPSLQGLQKNQEQAYITGSSEERDITVVEHQDAIVSAVEGVIATQKETIPYVYTLQQDGVTPFSATIEEYKGQLHAYIVYQHTAIDYIYTRMYPSDTVVRTTGDFERPLEEELESVTQNGLQWHIFTVSGTPNLYAKAEKDDIIYEIVAEDVNAEQLTEMLMNFQQ